MLRLMRLARTHSCRRLCPGGAGPCDAPAAALVPPHRHRQQPDRPSPRCIASFSLSQHSAPPAEDGTADAAGAGAAAGPDADDAWPGPSRRAGDEQLEPGLYVVGTPIGNLQDITYRALHILRNVNLVLAEDTRHTRKLLNYFNIRTEATSCHAHNEKAKEAYIMQRLRGGEALALVSDAGMPGISDPGQHIIAAAIREGVRVVPVPGPCALVAALVASGLPTDSFQFCGFLPAKSGARRQRLQSLSALQATLVFYSPPHGLRAVLQDMAAVLGPGRRCCVARELTKMHEEFYRSTLDGALQEFTRREPRGEMCIVVEGAPPPPTTAAGALLAQMMAQGRADSSGSTGAELPSAAAAAAADGPSPSSSGGAGRDVDEDGGPLERGVEGHDERAGVPGVDYAAGGPGGNDSGAQGTNGGGQLTAEAALRALLAQGQPASTAAKQVAQAFGTSRKELYALAVAIARGRG